MALSANATTFLEGLTDGAADIKWEYVEILVDYYKVIRRYMGKLRSLSQCIWNAESSGTFALEAIPRLFATAGKRQNVRQSAAQ